MTQQDTTVRAKSRLKKDPLEWVDDTSSSAPKPLENLVATDAYDLLMTAILVTDTDRVIRYANPAAIAIFGAAEQEVQKELPHFSVGTMVGQNIDIFHRNPEYQRAIMRRMTSFHDASFKTGDASIGFRVTRIMPDGETVTGYMVECRDISYETDSKEQMSKLMTKLNDMAESQLAGNASSILDGGDLTGSFSDLATKVNSMITMRNAVNLQALGWLKTFVAGDLDTKAPEFPGEMAIITKAIEGARLSAIQTQAKATEASQSIERLLEEIANMAEAHNDGRIDVYIDAGGFKGSLAVVAENVNEMVSGHIQLKQTILGMLEKFSKGDFDAPFPVLPGQRAFVTHGIEAMRSNFKSVMAEIARISGAIGEGHLDVVVDTTKFTGDYRSIVDQFAAILDSLNAVFGTITVEVSQASAAVSQMSEAAKELASNSQIQSASVDEVSASAEETDTQVKANAASAAQANSLVTGAALVADEGKEKISQMVAAMEGIRVSSQDIAKIIKVIDEIAFQTNLLALNAAVEAARAGQHGRGFAVVAQEVRNLAARSAKAARETSDLIESAGTRVLAGVKIADETSRAFTSIAEDIGKVRNFMHEIAVASNEQARGVAQINTAMGEVAKTALATSQQAEEVAENVADIERATERMREEMTRFQLRTKAVDEGHAMADLQSLPPELQAQIQALITARMSLLDGRGPRGRNPDRDERGFTGF
ncbi:MAG: methyl-accepting chemotaxis protein [Rhodobacteraceae bacterium]|nr:methyl-accepting chemotaxis protein [Paracoccaceae bacterium]MCF8513428.1 methyl-accepting chemotaxis protein [Paracoccaceae bacterium]MCF8517672.1 methyl-accepting chemotaxis protein [Paracoccaceae bacterium]